MTDVFKARFDGREWWAWQNNEVVILFHDKYHAELLNTLGPARHPEYIHRKATWIVPAHMVERELPPEPSVGTVLYDKDDAGWMRDQDLWMRCVPGESVDEAVAYKSLVQLRGPLHPYPKAARDEIARLTAERDELQGRIDRALTMVAKDGDWATTFFKQGSILRGKS